MAKKYNGTIFYREDKDLWVIQISLGYKNRNGKRKRYRITRYAKTKELAEVKLAELQKKYNLTENPECITVAMWTEIWLEIYKIPKLRENTLASYMKVLKYLIEAIGQMILGEVQPADLQRIIFVDIGVDKYRTCHYFRTVIKQLFARAVIDNYLPFSPAEYLELPPKPPKKTFIKPVVADWLILLNAEVDHYCWRMAILTVYVTGIRRSELLALTWDSFHIERENGVIIGGTVTIDKAMGIGVKLPKTGQRHVYIGRTKTESSIRTLTLPAEYIKELMKYKWKQNIMRLESKSWEHPEMVFTTNDGKYLNPGTFSSLFSRVCRENGIKNTFHQLRHDFATSMHSSHEFDFKDIQHQLGHSTIKITMDIYTHMQEEDLSRVKSWVDDRYAELSNDKELKKSQEKQKKEKKGKADIIPIKKVK